MALMPRKIKYRKSQKGKTRGISTNGNKIHFGEYGLKAIENGLIASNHIEACRVVVARKMKGVGKLWINIFPHKPVTKKPAETRMGKGKGELDLSSPGGLRPRFDPHAKKKFEPRHKRPGDKPRHDKPRLSC